MGQPELQWRADGRRSFKEGSIQSLFGEAFGVAGGSHIASGPNGWGPLVPLVNDSWQATTTFDLNLQPDHMLILGGNTTLALTNVSVGQRFTIILQQPSSGGPYTVTWFTTIRWPGATPPTLSTGAGQADTLAFICYSANNYFGYIAAQAQ